MLLLGLSVLFTVDVAVEVDLSAVGQADRLTQGSVPGTPERLEPWTEALVVVPTPITTSGRTSLSDEPHSRAGPTVNGFIHRPRTAVMLMGSRPLGIRLEISEAVHGTASSCTHLVSLAVD